MPTLNMTSLKTMSARRNGPLKISIWEAPIVDGAECQRQTYSFAVANGFSIFLFKLRRNFCQFSDGLGSGRHLENVGVHQCVVSSDAEHQMRSIGWNALQLRRNIFGHRTINRKQGRSPANGQQVTHLRDHVGAAHRIATIVENRIAKQNDMCHGRTGKLRRGDDTMYARGQRRLRSQRSQKAVCQTAVQAALPAALRH